MANSPTDIERYVLRPTPEEIRDTRVLFYTYNPANVTDEQTKLATLRELGLEVTLLTDPEPLFGDLDYDFIFTTQLEGLFPGHEGLIPALAARRGIPCLGAHGPTRAISEDKLLGKAVAASLGVEVARHRLVDPREPGISNLYPPGRWILKPRRGVMSDHISYIEDAYAWRKAVTRAAHPMHGGQEFLAEEFVPGLNLAVPVVEGFPPGAFPAFLERGEARHNILTKSGKEGDTPDYASEPYDGPGAAQARAAAARLAAAIAPFDYARFDFRYEPVADRLVFLEVNMNCAMGPPTVVGQAALLAGMDYPAFVGHVFAHSLRRQRRAA
jgi:D-alanine-D-alanine ligase